MNDDLIRYDERLSALVVRPRGELTAERLLLVLRTIAIHPRASKGVPSIWDLRQASVGAISNASLTPVVEFVEQHAAWRGRARIGLVADDPAMYGMMRVYERLVSDFLECVPCHTMEEAERWIQQERVRGA